MKKNLTFIIVLLTGLMAVGCSDTWKGAKKDANDNAQWSEEKAKDGADWSKDKVHDGAEYIEKKTD